MSKKCCSNPIYACLLDFALLLPSHTHTLSLTHTQRGRPGVPVWPADEGVELVTPPWGVRPQGLQYHRADPLQPAWFGSSSGLPTHSNSWHIAHSTHCTAQRLTAALHELMLWCSIKTPLSNFLSKELIWSWKLNSTIKIKKCEIQRMCGIKRCPNIFFSFYCGSQ